MIRDRIDIAALLPRPMRDALPYSPVLAGLLEIMDGLLSPVDLILDELHEHFAPRRAPAPWVAYLGAWLNIGLALPDGSDGRLRELVAIGSELAQTRGTVAGLEKLIRTATGIHGVRIEPAVDASGAVQPFAIAVHLPKEAAPYKELVERMVALEKPAYLTHEVVSAEP